MHRPYTGIAYPSRSRIHDGIVQGHCMHRPYTVIAYPPYCNSTIERTDDPTCVVRR